MQQPTFIVIVTCKIRKISDVSYNSSVRIIKNNKYFLVVIFFYCDLSHDFFLNQFIMHLN